MLVLPSNCLRMTAVRAHTRTLLEEHCAAKVGSIHHCVPGHVINRVAGSVLEITQLLSGHGMSLTASEGKLEKNGVAIP